MAPLILLMIVGLASVSGANWEENILRKEAAVIKMLFQPTVSEDKACTDCLKFIGDIQTVMSSRQVAETIALHVDMGCALVGSAEAQCKEMEKRGDVPIYNPVILDDIDFSRHRASFNPAITPSNLGEGLIMRPLCLQDFDRGYMELLDEHVPNGLISKEKFTERFNKMKLAGDIHFITVIEDTTTNKTIASATLVNELKFLMKATSRGRIEDVVVSKPYRGRQFGKILLETLTLLAEQLGCYESSLECEHKNITYYSKFGYQVEPNDHYMTLRFK